MLLVRRREFLAGFSLTAATQVVAQEREPELRRVQAAVGSFANLPVTTSCFIATDHPTPWTVGHAGARLFVGSAVKTFILAAYLRDVESGRLTLDQQLAINDDVRSPSSPVFMKLTGTTEARSVLEAMIAHSDNTATDAALKAVGPDACGTSWGYPQRISPIRPAGWFRTSPEHRKAWISAGRAWSEWPMASSQGRHGPR